ncbi:TetR/AcrR family transcriptional regulator [Streptomyces sp. FIT100]|uniref:TetR/AcrR family transcriptional regulator n=1 Tax=Streptomyces sp. FIT100 TaxID=2837956 RepID=UPI0021CA0BE4|nr:TetR/AcrR family transcriptional regulator [Streptomyces sp. FIT100]UUN30031.1 TetR/AcrR family transcriptional regulator [Streptomyces sp. FIT100]
MARPPDPAKRRALLNDVREYVIHHGLADLSLRPMARALGTSDRMLLYYFGTKERLVAEALAVDERRPLLRFRHALDGFGPVDDPEALRRFLEEMWRRVSAPDRRPVLPLYFELMAASLMNPAPYGPVAHDAVREWAALLAPLFLGLGLPEDRARNEATLLVGTALGLLVTPLADGDWDRADAAFRTLLDSLAPGWHLAR